MPALVSSSCSLVMPGLRATPAIMTTTSESAVSSYPLLPVMRTSTPRIGAACVRSRALPIGIFSMMSTRTRSATSSAASQCAVVCPTMPAPMMLTFDLPLILHPEIQSTQSPPVLPVFPVYLLRRGSLYRLDRVDWEDWVDRAD